MLKLQFAEIIRRLNEASNRKINDARKECTKAKRELDDKTRARLIRTCAVKMKPDYQHAVDGWDKIEQVFDFSKYEWDAEVNEVQFDKKVKAIQKAANAVRDAAIQDKTEHALYLLKRFEV